MVVTGYTDGPIPWPLGRVRGRGGKPFPVLHGALVRAVRRESVVAVCHWFGVSRNTVWRWRKALGVEFSTEGTFRLKSRHSKEPWAVAARKKAWAKANDPDRRRKIAESRRGKPRPRHVIEAMRKGRTGKPHPPEVRARLSAFLRERAKVFVPSGRLWTAAEDELVRTLPAPEAARRTDRSLEAIYLRRRRLGVPDGRDPGPHAAAERVNVNRKKINDVWFADGWRRPVQTRNPTAASSSSTTTDFRSSACGTRIRKRYRSRSLFRSAPGEYLTMCARFTLYTEGRLIAERFQLARSRA